MGKTLRRLQYPGKLIVVEGIDGSGKSTQLDLLRKWMMSQGYLIAFSEWNSSPLVNRITKRGKKQKSLTPVSFSLIHAADFIDRLERQIVHALEAGAIVLADRYVYTAFARDVVRGVEPQWVRDEYAMAPQPTLAIYFRVPLEESLNRILVGRPALKYYEAGLDLGWSSDPYESFRLFQGRILQEYDKIVEEYSLSVIDATQPLVKQQRQVRELVEPHLNGALKVDLRAWRDVLSKEALLGHYLKGIGARDQSEARE
ncbi:MAG: thymidylate kinase [Chloroflexi bacterium]|nr:thymidylate kinase [Chloroflexota bacterium]